MSFISESNIPIDQDPPQPTVAESEARVAAEFLKQGTQPPDLPSKALPDTSWIWHGYIGPGKLTLLTSQWKSGKTTLVSVLLARMVNGGILAGLPVKAGRAAMISEESAGEWDARCRKLRIGTDRHLNFYCRPFANRPTMVEWRGMIQGLLDLRRRDGLDLVVIDPIAVFLPVPSENVAR
jgi:hypothetical protein